MISLCFLNLFLAVLGLRECMGFSQVATSGGYSRVAGHGLFRVGASLVVDVRVGLQRKLSTEQLMLWNCGVGEDS